jgi:hypothetical protein
MKLTYANVASTLALFFALAGGTTAIALSGKNTVQRDDIAPNAVGASELAKGAVGKLNDTEFNKSVSSTKPIALSGAYQPILSDKISVPKGPPKGPKTGVSVPFTMEIYNSGNFAEVVSVRVRMGDEIEELSYEQTVQPGESEIVAGIIVCNWVPADSPIALEVQGPGMTINDRSMSAVEWRPIVVPPG